MRVAGVVLAAGGGTRLGQPKALVELDGRRLVDQAVQACALAGLDPVVVVTGAAPVEQGSLPQAGSAGGPDVVLAHNADWESGQASSLRTGLAAASAVADVEGAVVTLVDTPGVGPEHLRRVAGALAGGATAAVAAYEGRPRTPVALMRQVWDDVCAGVGGDEGARTWLRAHPELVATVECGDLGPWRDIDVPDDLRR